MQVVFLGSGYFGLSVLKALLKLSNLDIIDLKKVISQSSKYFGRKQIIFDNLVVKYVKEAKLKDFLITPTSIKELKDFTNFDIGIVASYGNIIPEWFMNKFKFGMINFHASLLPKYRGAIPIQSILSSQDYEALGISIIKISRDLDAGDIILSKKLDISYEQFQNSTALELTQALADLSYNLLIKEYKYILDPKNWVLQKQDDSKASYCFLKDLKKENFEVFLYDDIRKAHGKIMAGNPDPKAFVITNEGIKFNLLRSKINLCTEKINFNDLNTDKYFICYNGKLILNLKNQVSEFLEILEIQPEGKKVLNSKDFINGYSRFIYFVK